MLVTNQLDHYYGQSHCLRGVDLEVAKASCTCLMGRNGVGKTTFAKCVIGLETPKNGEMFYDGYDLFKLSVEKRAAAGIGYVPQGRQIFPLLTVEENIRTGFFASGHGRSSIPDEVYELFPVLLEMKNRRGGDLSGGQQQQLAIARALVLKPTMLILDEPAEGIQPNVVQEIAEVIKMLSHEMAISVLLIEQKLPFIRKVADCFAIMDRGSIVANGRMDELNEDHVSEYLVA